MSFFGGGTDMESFFKEHGGAVISTTFDKYCYVNVRHLPAFFDYTNEFSYSEIEQVKSIDEIKHPAIRNAMIMLDMRDLRLSYEADLPARTGLGTSSSFAVGMLNAFHAIKGQFRSKRALATEAIYLERELCKEAGGWQDQIAAAYGGLNRIDFKKDGTFAVHPIIIQPERKLMLNDNLLMFFTGISRFSHEIQSENQKNVTPETAEQRERRLMEMLSLVNVAEEILTEKSYDLDDFGALLNETWNLKRQTGSAITTSRIDELYERGLKAGALGGKLLGAGGGGFLIFYVPENKHDAVLNEMRELLHIPFQFEDEGTSVLDYAPESIED